MKVIAATLFALWTGQAVVQPSAREVRALPADTRLDPVRGSLQGVLDRAERDALPVEVILNKIKEGLAKKVPPARIADVARRLGEQLHEARDVLADKGIESPSERLFRALSEAQMAGFPAAELAPLFGTSASEDANTAAVHAVTDLAVRGYPRADALAIVRATAAKDVAGLPAVASALERLRREYAMNHLEALAALQSSLAVSTTLGGAFNHASNNAGGARAVGGPARGKSEGNTGKGLGLGATRGRGQGKGKGPK